MTDNKHYIFLEKLRRSGKIYNLEAISYIMAEFGYSPDKAEEVLADWMMNYKQSDYEGMFDNVPTQTM